ncbi:AraC family transcriptional regulator [Nocardioides sp. WV_118_6]|uniref:AraC family transcriptional regulator n=1 Tax=Nocardioides simplex TaxID=2045 RepID=UPI00214FDC03|nr:AraC family transcriptional regulator [Pimelobacter simplex]UUW87117.1 AraC family transcriptional regulator [Pimelobacter simplex]UUW96623.1 AraC family transcriptional regulator [Pimelobacter simplex]
MSDSRARAGGPDEAAPARYVEVTGIDAWADACSCAYVPLAVDVASPYRPPATPGVDVRGAVRERVLGTVGITQIGSTPATVTRTERSVRTDPREVFMVAVFLGGGGTTVQAGRVARCARRSGFLMDGDRPYSMRFEEGNDLLALRLPRERLTASDRTLRGITSTAVPGSSDTLNVLRRYLAGLVAMRRPIAAPAVATHQEIAVELANALVHEMVYPERSMPALSGGALVASVRWFMDQNYADPQLSIDEIARRFMISRRYLEKLFAAIDDGAPAAYLRRQRLRRAAALLAAYPELKVERIARDVGFIDVNTFARAFRREFGANPRTWRRDRGRTSAALLAPGPGRPLLASLDEFDWTA